MGGTGSRRTGNDGGRRGVVIAVTGNTGGGKSAVTAHFARWGADVIDADAVGRSIWQRDADIRARIIAAFGEEVTGDDGEVDRKKLGGVVFSSRDKLARFDAIIQPALRREIARLLEEARRREPVTVLDGALLFEWDLSHLADRVIVVTAPREVRAARIVTRDGISIKEARERLRLQTPEEKKAGRADFVIRNDGTPEELARESRAVWERIVSAGGKSNDRRE